MVVTKYLAQFVGSYNNFKTIQITLHNQIPSHCIVRSNITVKKKWLIIPTLWKNWDGRDYLEEEKVYQPIFVESLKFTWASYKLCQIFYNYHTRSLGHLKI